MTIDVTLPSLNEPGDYAVTFDLVVEGVTWFGNRGSSPAELELHVI